MSATEPAPAWQWPEHTWRGHVEAVRAGRRLVPRRWPGDARVAVALSFDSDHETIPLRDAETSPGRLAQGEYGSRVGAGRVLEVLADFGAPATFFMPGVSALLHPGEAKDYAAAGHEIGVHGWIHERNTLLGKEDEKALNVRAIDVLAELTGVRPVGIRTPSWDFSESTLDVIRELGFEYDSSLMADDEPYEIVANGAATGLVEIPVDWIRDDAPYFTMDRYGSVRPHTRPRDVLEIWTDEFDAAHRTGGVFQLTMHPHVIGHRSRLVVLRELLDHIGAHHDVWFATHAELAATARAELGRLDPLGATP
ncbi:MULTISPECIES: polysaccharide deacetylase [unclassified Saccharopolyspora]|uniref:polysaccharide deacetylase family protein n=1 Tax=unclassified Saccharopolyspora TaxID=2646250 RepID=UPI001CD1DE37|nr:MULTISPECIES: polysaccharide deacetylase [unclassified Saccharopolyspora]MCA1185033.1 polysaccharide deacetylase [Saccharopolyspora sp. 6T]MCA1190755.1 polysaccharide deacetylase [Saccharopolyspora sp. 6V]MCA1278219.1 polysaccharide deacetylase [Saccharopolyspora sp. 7B]